MPLWTISELMHPTRDELCYLATPLKMRCKTLRPARSKSERADEPHQHPSDHGLPGSPSLSRSRYHRGSPTKAARSKAAPARRAARRPFPANVCLYQKTPNRGFHINAEYKRCAPLMTRNSANSPAKTREGSQCATATPRRTVTSVPATRAASAGKLM
jgi:hypothetical protein